MIKFIVIPKNYLILFNLANWCFGQSYQSENLQDWKINIFLSFSGEKWIWEDWEYSFCRNFRPQLLRDRKRSSATHHLALGKKMLLWLFCQLQIDHATQQLKETCQRTCFKAQRMFALLSENKLHSKDKIKISIVFHWKNSFAPIFNCRL